MATMLLDELHSYYVSQGISPDQFTCPLATSCRGDSPNFSGPREAFVGREYESGGIPRLLFLSLDPGSIEVDHCRTVHDFRDWQERPYSPNQFPKNRHWYLTHWLAWKLLAHFIEGVPFPATPHYFA